MGTGEAARLTVSDKTVGELRMEVRVLDERVSNLERWFGLFMVLLLFFSASGMVLFSLMMWLHL